MKCQEVTRLGVAYLNGEASTSERHLIQLHLAECEHCQHELAMIATLQGHVSQSLKRIAAPAEPPPQAWERLQAKLPRRGFPLSGRAFSVNVPAWLRITWQLGRDMAVLALLIVVTSLAIRLLPQVTERPAPAKMIGFNLTQGQFDDVRDLDWAYNGLIVFAARNGQDPYHLYTINSDGSGLFQLTNAATNDTAPRWSPNGIQIAYLAATPEKTDLMTIYRDGSRQNNLTEYLPGSVLNLAWSLNGADIAYVLEQNGSSDLNIVNNKGADFLALRLTHQFGIVGSPVWIPQSDCLLFSASSPDGTNLDVYQASSCKPDLPPTRLTESPADDFNLQWHPKEEKFLYQSGTDLYEMDIQTLTSARLIADGFAVAISPDGEMLAFQSGRSGTNQLFILVMNSDGKDDLLFLEQPGLIEQAPIWSADEQRLAFSARPDPNRAADIFIVDVQDFVPWRPQP